MSTAHYLRVEGVNLSAFVFDTRDLSTNRGGGLMLLDAIKVVIDKLGLKQNSDKVISRGASSGLFRIDGDAAAAEQAAEDTRKVLAAKFPYATFVVDVVEQNIALDSLNNNRIVRDTYKAGTYSSFRNCVESLIAANRWQQMQSSTLAVPKASSQPADWSQPACDLDGLRPAEAGKNGSHTIRGKQMSDATKERRDYGRDKKQNFYEDVTGLKNLPSFAENFEEIALGSKPLDGKLAVFYADGNGFGKIQSDCCKEESQSAFDKYIRKSREKFLREFLQFARNRREWLNFRTKQHGKTMEEEFLKDLHEFGRDGKKWQNQKGTLRFETLLWGGDEFFFVMPAALGWSFATCFFKSMSNLNFQGERLTHAAGLVFCQHHSPIHRIKNLAKDGMTEFAKGVDRTQDSLTVVALESFDHLGTDYEQAMSDRYRALVDLKDMILVASGKPSLGDTLASIAEHVTALRASESFPRSQLRRLVNTILAQATPKDAQNIAASSDAPYFKNADENDRKHLEALRPLFRDQDLIRSLQLEELWEYAIPEKSSK